MLESEDRDPPDSESLELIYQRAPHGAMVIAAIATALVFAMWFAFYLFIFIPRGLLH